MKMDTLADLDNLLKIKTKYIPRKLETKLLSLLKEKEVVVLYGARQVGKSTLVLHTLKEFLQTIKTSYDLYYYNLDSLPEEFKTPDTFVNYLKATRKDPSATAYIIIDEAQRLENIGLFVKYIFDRNINTKIILTGSASLDIKEKIKEPLTGRKFELFLKPLSFSEILASEGIDHKKTNTPIPQINKLFEDYLLFGGYPKVHLAKTKELKQEYLIELTESYLLKDLADLFDIKNTEVIKLVATFVAENIGNLLNKDNISEFSGITKHQVIKTLDALEKTFVLKRVTPFYTRKSKELSHRPKMYFYDFGLRNTLLNKLNKIAITPDIGKLFENFVLNLLLDQYGNNNVHFWRTINQTEIDFVCIKEARAKDIYEVKYTWSKETLPKSMQSFKEQYKQTDIARVINKNNFIKLL